MVYLKVKEILNQKKKQNIGLLKKWKEIINHSVTY